MNFQIPFSNVFQKKFNSISKPTNYSKQEINAPQFRSSSTTRHVPHSLSPQDCSQMSCNDPVMPPSFDNSGQKSLLEQFLDCNFEQGCIDCCSDEGCDGSFEKRRSPDSSGVSHFLKFKNETRPMFHSTLPPARPPRKPTRNRLGSVGHSSKDNSITLLDRLNRTTPIWYNSSLSRHGAVRLLRDKNAGNFIVRPSSQPNTMALSVRMPESSHRAVDHYLIIYTSMGLKIEGSDRSFSQLDNLVCHYSTYSDGLPCRLTLPSLIMQANSFRDLATLSLLGSDFWISRHPLLAPKKGITSSPSELSSGTDSYGSSLVTPQPNSDQCSSTTAANSISSSLHSSPKTLPRDKSAECFMERLLHLPPPRPPKSELVRNKLVAQDNQTKVRRNITPLQINCLAQTTSSPLGKGKCDSGYESPPVASSASSSVKNPFRPPTRPSSFSDSELITGTSSTSIKVDVSERDSGAFSDDHTPDGHKHYNPNNPFLSLVYPDTLSTSEQSSPAASVIPQRVLHHLIEGGRCGSGGSTPFSLSDGGGCVSSRSYDRNWVSPGDDGELGYDSSLISWAQGLDNAGCTRDDTSCSTPNEIDPLMRSSLMLIEDSDQNVKSRKRFHFPRLTPNPVRFLNGPLRRRHRNPSIPIRDYIVSLAADKQCLFGRAVDCFVSGTLEQSIEKSDGQKLLESVRQFMNRMKSHLINHSETGLSDVILKEQSKLRSHECINMDGIAEAALHRAVIKPLKEHIFKVLHFHHSKDGSIDRLTENIGFAKNKTLSELGLDSRLNPPTGSTLNVVQLFLNKLISSYSPQTKLQHLLSAMQAMQNSTQSNTTVGADDLLPILIYVLANTEMVSAELEENFIWNLLPPTTLAGDSRYNLMIFSSAVKELKNLKEAANANRHVSLPRITDMQGFVKIVIPDESNESIITKTLPVKPNMTVKELCNMIALKFKLPHPDDNALFYVIDGKETQLDANECPQNVRGRLVAEKKDFIFAYKRIAANIIWPT